jgi:hypothetical protein
MDFDRERRDDPLHGGSQMTPKDVTLHAPSAAPEIAITAFVLLVLGSSAALLVCWLGIGA